jgi:Zn-dependent protease with chaperone function
MRFRQHQDTARQETTRLFVWFGVLLLALVLAINLVMGVAYKLLLPFTQGWPNLFFETNTALVLMFVLGGCWVETLRLKDGGGVRVAHWMGGREITEASNTLERRLLNVVEEMAIASGQPAPRVFVLPREDAINAFVAGWHDEDRALAVTRGALERLTRHELQGLVAHEFGHIKEGDLPLSMRLIALVWGLSLVHGYGQNLMAADDRGHVHPLPWVVGLVFTTVGWLGWLAGRVLQAAVSRQREHLADASAIQFSRSREGLGNTLRKIWHDQQALAGRMRNPSASMIAAMLLHEPEGVHWMATHPKLSERIRRICGAVMPPIPAPLLREIPPEPSRPRKTRGLPPGAVLNAQNDHASDHANDHAGNSSHDPAQGPSAPADTETPGHTSTRPPAGARGSAHDPTQPPPSAERQAQAREALGRLQRRQGPTEIRLVLLALMMNPDNPSERKWWLQHAQALPQADQILDEVAQLLPHSRVPEFERVTDTLQTLDVDARREVVILARDLLRADGRVSPRERLWWLVLRHRLAATGARPAMMRPVTGQGQGLIELSKVQRTHVSTVSSYLARFIPEDEHGPGAWHSASTAWYRGVMQRCGVEDTPPGVVPPPDADQLMTALAAVQELSWMVRPLLLKAWVEEAFNHSPKGVLRQDTADALRLMASLVDSPLPAMLAAHYPRA